MLNIGLASEILFVGTDAQVDTGDIHERWPSWVYRTWLAIKNLATNGKANVNWLHPIWLLKLAA